MDHPTDPATADSLNGGKSSGVVPVTESGGTHHIVGTASADSLYGSKTSGDDLIEGLDGNDTLSAGVGADTLLGGAGSDELNGGFGIDSLDGGSGNDLLRDEDGNDTLAGGAGNDQLYGGKGDDVLAGGAGDDVIEGDGGMFLQHQQDTVEFSGKRSDYVVTFDADTLVCTVKDLVAGRDGSDSVRFVETFSFADGDFSVQTIAPGYDTAYAGYVAQRMAPPATQIDDPVMGVDVIYTYATVTLVGSGSAGGEGTISGSGWYWGIASSVDY